VFPDPPEGLSGDPLAFYDELRRMVAAVAPPQLDAARSSVVFVGNAVEVEFVHGEREDWAIWAQVDRSDARVGTLWAHEHFTDVSDAVDFIAELLRGEIEVELTFRGDTLTRVRHTNAEGLEMVTAFVVPGRFALWRPQRTERHRSTFF
jgi:hypothetical protein